MLTNTARQLLSDLTQHDARSFSGSAGGDLAEIVSYYTSHKSADAFIISDLLEFEILERVRRMGTRYHRLSGLRAFSSQKRRY